MSIALDRVLDRPLPNKKARNVPRTVTIAFLAGCKTNVQA
jgi:hypothetical protein